MPDESQKDLDSIKDEHLKEEMIVRKWRHRRRMAYIALTAMLVMTVALFFFVDESRLDKIQDAISWAFIMMGGIVGSYMGAATWDGKK